MCVVCVWVHVSSVVFVKGTTLTAESRAVCMREDTWREVGMQSYLKKEGYDQIPQLSVGNTAFKLRGKFSVMHPKRKKKADSTKEFVGNTRAVLIGINYTGGAAPLDGACNDVSSMKQYIVEQGYADDKHSMRVLRDDGEPGDLMPTKKNIIAALKWLVEGATKGDSLFLHYSGHGSSMKDGDGDEEDGTDEVMLPSDYTERDENGALNVIVDDEIFDLVVAPLKKAGAVSESVHVHAFISPPPPQHAHTHTM